MLRKKVGLALSGGGARGFSHVGVIKILAEHDIPIDMIAGTSAGAFVGGLFAAGASTDDLVRIANKIGWLNMVRPAFSRKGFLSNAPMGRFIESNFPVNRFEDLKIPFAATAYDFNKSELVIQKDHGDLAFGIRASCCIPGVFAPLSDGSGRLLVDGGVASPLPTEVVRSMGAEIVIAVDLITPGPAIRSGGRSAFGIAVRSTLTLIRIATANQRPLADIVIEPEIGHIRPDQISKRDELIRLGEEAAREQIDAIRELIRSAESV